MMTEMQIKAALDGRFFAFSPDGEVKERKVSAGYRPNGTPRVMTVREREDEQRRAAREAAAHLARLKELEEQAQRRRRTKLTDIVGTVCAVCRIGRGDLMAQSRRREIVRARFMVFWLGRNLNGLSLPQIGMFMRRDHSTVLHGITSVDANRERFEPELSRAMKLLRPGWAPTTEQGA